MKGMTILTAILPLFLISSRAAPSPDDTYSADLYPFSLEIKSQSQTYPHGNYLNDLSDYTIELLNSFFAERLTNLFEYEFTNADLTITEASFSGASSVIRTTFEGFVSFETSTMPGPLFMRELLEVAFTGESKKDFLVILHSSDDEFLGEVDDVIFSFVGDAMEMQNREGEGESQTENENFFLITVILSATIGLVVTSLVGIVIYKVMKKEEETYNVKDFEVASPRTDPIPPSPHSSPGMDIRDDVSIASTRFTYSGAHLPSCYEQSEGLNDTMSRINDVMSLDGMTWVSPKVPHLEIPLTVKLSSVSKGVTSHLLHNDKASVSSGERTDLSFSFQNDSLIEENNKDSHAYASESPEANAGCEIISPAEALNQSNILEEFRQRRFNFDRNYAAHNSVDTPSTEACVISISEGSDVIKDLQRLSSEIDEHRSIENDSADTEASFKPSKNAVQKQHRSLDTTMNSIYGNSARNGGDHQSYVSFYSNSMETKKSDKSSKSGGEKTHRSVDNLLNGAYEETVGSVTDEERSFRQPLGIARANYATGFK